MDVMQSMTSTVLFTLVLHHLSDLKGIDRMRAWHHLIPLLFLLPASLPAQGPGGDTGESDSTEDWESVEISEGEQADPPGGFGLYFGPTYELFTLKTTSLDPELDQDLFMIGGYGYALVADFVIGGGWTSITLEEPNEQYDRFSFGYAGVLTGYDYRITNKFSARITLLVGGGELEMIKTRNDLSGLGPNQFLERFRSEEFFLLQPGFSLGYAVLPFLDLRAQGARLLPIGGANVSDLGEWTVGLHAMFGFRNNIF